MKRIIILLLMIQMSLIGLSTVRYVSNAGFDTNDGLSTATSWATVSKVNSAILAAGDSILFKRGDSWAETLIPQSGTVGNPITYSVYGTGNKPILHNSVTLNSTSDWTEESSHVWKTVSTLAYDVGNVIFNIETSVGVKKWNKVDITSQGQYWYDNTNDLLYLYSTSNPATFYTEVRACLNYQIVLSENKSYITFDNLAVRYGASNGFHSTNCIGITISNCDVSWIGGGDFGAPTRYGNGIQFYASAQNILVANCKIWECYDAGVTNQYQPTTGTIVQSNITYQNNTIWNCEYSFEYFNRSTAGETSNLLFENNTCYNAGGGWAHAQRPDPTGYHLRLAGTTTNTTNFIIQNNIFHGATGAIHMNYVASTSQYTIVYNDLYQSTGNYAYLAGIYYTNFATYKSASGWDANSINANPALTNIAALNFTQTSASPTIDVGNPTSSNDPDGTRRDMGYLYFNQSTPGGAVYMAKSNTGAGLKSNVGAPLYVIP